MLVITVCVGAFGGGALLAALVLCCFIGNFYIVMERASSMKLNYNCYEMLTFTAQMRDVTAIRGGLRNYAGSTLSEQMVRRVYMVRRVRVALDDAPSP